MYQFLGCAIGQLGVIAGGNVENFRIAGKLAHQHEERLADYVTLIGSHTALRPCHYSVMQKVLVAKLGDNPFQYGHCFLAMALGAETDPAFGCRGGRLRRR